MAADAGELPRFLPIAFDPARLHFALGAGMRQVSFYKAFDHLMLEKGFRSTARSHWARSCGRGAISMYLDLRPVSHDYDVQFGVTYSHRPAPDRLTVFDCVAHGWPEGMTAAQRKSWQEILEEPVRAASRADALETLSTLIDVHLRTLRHWEDPRHLYHDLHRGRAVQMLVNWRRLIEACKRYDRAEANKT